MIFNSKEQFETYVLKKCEKAVAQAERQVYDVIKKFLDKFYGEYTPVEYNRTEQFLRSLVKSDVKIMGNQVVAEVYFDLSKINYPDPAQGKSGRLHDRQATNEEILKNTLTGVYPHGWYEPAGGTGVWTGAFPVIDANAIEYLKNELIASGIPIVKG